MSAQKAIHLGSCPGRLLSGVGGGVGSQQFVYQKWPNQIFPTAKFVFPHDGPFGLGGGGLGKPPPKLQIFEGRPGHASHRHCGAVAPHGPRAARKSGAQAPAGPNWVADVTGGRPEGEDLAVVGLSLRGGERGFVAPTESNIHGHALCFVVKTWARHNTTEALLNNGWRLVAVRSGWRLAVCPSGWVGGGGPTHPSPPRPSHPPQPPPPTTLKGALAVPPYGPHGACTAFHCTGRGVGVPAEA